MFDAYFTSLQRKDDIAMIGAHSGEELGCAAEKRDKMGAGWEEQS